MEKIHKLKNRQEFKFAAIGALNTILDISILFILKFVGLSAIVANIFSTSTTFCLSFFLNKKITFQSENKTKSQLAREMALFTVVTLFGLWVIQGLIIGFLSPSLQLFLNNQTLALLISKIIATVFSLTWNFILYKKVVFKN